jgi:hypothetical protein
VENIAGISDAGVDTNAESDAESASLASLASLGSGPTV